MRLHCIFVQYSEYNLIMKYIKLLWSIAFSFAIVLLYATVTSLFVDPFSTWYLALAKTPTTPGSITLSVGWAINYAMSIVLLTRIIYDHDNLKSIALFALIGVCQILWSILFFACHSLLWGVIAELLLIIVSITALVSISKNRINTLLFIPILAWYIYSLIAGFNLLLVNV